jgi:hypothetical protein
LFSMILFAASCKKKTFSVQGRWRPIAVDGAYVKSFGLKDEEVKELLAKSMIGFQSGGLFFSFQAKDTVRGIYTYDESNKRLSTIPEGTSSQTFSVEFLQSDEMTLTNSFGKMTLKRL